MDIIMIRHGQTEDNIDKIFSRDSTSLSQRGIDEMLLAKKALTQFKYERIYYSPLNRTVQSLQYLELKGKVEDRIKEIDFGVFTGKTFKEISEIYPIESKAWVSDSINYRTPEGESVLDVYKRTSRFLEELVINGKDSLLICHDCVIRLAFCWIFDNPDYFFKFKVDNGSINIISVDDNYKYIKKTNYKHPLD